MAYSMPCSSPIITEMPPEIHTMKELDFLKSLIHFRFSVFIVSMYLFGAPHPVSYVYHKMLLNENKSNLVVVARQILLVTTNYVY